MADRTLTINHADGGSETYTLKTEDVLGVRSMQVDGETVTVDRTAPDLVRTIIADGQTITIDTTREGVRTLTVDGTEITIDRTEEANLQSFLQQFTGAAAAYSLRDLASNSGNTTVVRVRRSSDNFEADFSATEVSNGTLTAWVGTGNDGFVETWYDQSGNGNDATQLTASYQPKIVDAGALVQEGGNSSLEFDGVDDYLVTTQGYIVEISQNPASVFAVANPDAISEGYLMTEGDSAPTYSSSFILNGAGAANGASTVWANATKVGSGFPASLTLGGFIYNGTNFQAYLNGSADGASGTADINAETSIQSYIGTRADGTTDFFGGKVSEIITYKSDQSANRPAIEANINNQYDIY